MRFVLVLVLLSASLASATGGPTPGLLLGAGAILLVFAALFGISVRAYVRLAEDAFGRSREAGRKAVGFILGTQGLILALGFLRLGFLALPLELIWMLYPLARRWRSPRGSAPERGRRAPPRGPERPG